METSVSIDTNKFKIYHKEIFQIIHSTIKISFLFLSKEVKQDDVDYVQKLKRLQQKEEEMILKLHKIIKNNKI